MKPREITKTTPRRDRKVVAAEIAEDFTRIQVLNNGLGEAVSGSAPLNFEFVAKSAAELVERSKRLGENLGHLEPEKGSKPPKPEPMTDVEQLRGALATLDKLVSEFTHNPLFTDASTRNAELFVKAHRDLAEITALSEHIKKDAEVLSKTARQSK
jgi:cytochrome c556